MNRLLLVLLALLVSSFALTCYAGPKFVVASYNVENLFDTTHDPGKNDTEYTPEGKAQWTPEKLNLKLEQVAKEIRAINNGQGPDVIALPETENINALNMLNAKLKDLKYHAILLEGPDQRGIDVAMLSKFPLARKPLMFQVSDLNNPMWKRPTRPVYDIVLQVAPGVNFGILMNHWPARMSPPIYRCAAGQVLRKVFQAHMKKDPDIDYIALGDFNDEPQDQSITNCLGTGTIQQVISSTTAKPLFFDLYNEANLPVERSGTYFYDRKNSWNALDHIIISRGLFDRKNISYVPHSFSRVMTLGLNVFNKPIKLPDGEVIDAGTPVPFTTMGTPGKLKYIGVSDHLPVRAVFEINQ